MAEFLLGILALYGLAGVLAALGLVAWGIGPMDPSAAHGSWGFRLAILPGLVALWPLILVRALRVRWGNGTLPVPEKPVPPRALRAVHGRLILFVFLLAAPVVVLGLCWKVRGYRDLPRALAPVGFERPPAGQTGGF
jgi:hypothetical protein